MSNGKWENEDSYGFDYKPKDLINRGQYQINQRYFSGSQAHLFIGDVWVDDILSIAFSVAHNRNPVYGYGSQHFDFMPQGTILISGTFAINFREPNYLWAILKRHQAFQIGTHDSHIDEDGVGNRRRDSSYKMYDVANLDINKDIEDRQTRKNLDFFFSTDKIDVARQNKLSLQSYISTKGQTQQVKENMNHSKFNIILGYGEQLDADTVGEKINDIFIVGKAKAINIDGRPLQEEYSFLARMLT